MIGAKISGVKINLFGINLQININELSYKKKIALYFSGPFVNVGISLLFYVNYIYEIFYINFILAMINLIPITPLDGGNIVKSILENYIKKPYVYTINLVINIIFLLLAVYCLITSYNIFYLAVSFMAVKGIIYERNNKFEEKIRNTYKKFI